MIEFSDEEKAKEIEYPLIYCPCGSYWEYDSLSPVVCRKCEKCGKKQKADYSGDIIAEGINWVDENKEEIK